MGSIVFDVSLSKNGFTNNGTSKLAFIIPAEITKMIQTRFPDQQLKITIQGVKKTITFVARLGIHSKKKKYDARLKAHIPQMFHKEAESFKDELLHIRIESI